MHFCQKEEETVEPSCRKSVKTFSNYPKSKFKYCTNKKVNEKFLLIPISMKLVFFIPQKAVDGYIVNVPPGIYAKHKKVEQKIPTSKDSSTDSNISVH